MKNYIQRADGYLVDGSTAIPPDLANADYSRALAMVAAGSAQFIAPPPTKPELKAAALAAATALGFSVEQLRVIRALYFLQTGTPAQKTKATALLQPLAKLAGDARRISDQIDADLPPDVLAPAIIPTDDP